MDGLIVRMLARKCDRVRDLERVNAELTAALAVANRTAEAALAYGRSARQLVDALWLIADPGRRDMVLGVLESIDRLPEVKA